MAEISSDWILSLYVAGKTPKANLAYSNLKKICDEYLHRKCSIRIVDLLKNPKIAKEEHIMAIPTIVREYPLPEIRLIGDLSNTERVLSKLDLK